MVRMKVLESRGCIFLLQQPDGYYTVERQESDNTSTPLVKTRDKQVALIVYKDFAQEVGL